MTPYLARCPRWQYRLYQRLIWPLLWWRPMFVLRLALHRWRRR